MGIKSNILATSYCISVIAIIGYHNDQKPLKLDLNSSIPKLIPEYSVYEAPNTFNIVYEALTFKTRRSLPFLKMPNGDEIVFKKDTMHPQLSLKDNVWVQYGHYNSKDFVAYCPKNNGCTSQIPKDIDFTNPNIFADYYNQKTKIKEDSKSIQENLGKLEKSFFAPKSN